MTAIELEENVSLLLAMCREAKRDFECATENEAYPNKAIQDILHAIEFAPEVYLDESLIQTLHTLRQQRRDSKRELEVTTIFNNWCTENQAAIRKLEQVLGEMRKVLRRQPNDFYIWKTDVLGAQGQTLTKPEIPEPPNDPYTQLSFFEEGNNE